MNNRYFLCLLIFTAIIKFCQSNEEEQYDIVIIGAGISGLFAAYEANKVLNNNSYKIAVFDRKKEVGGNSMNKIEGINILNSDNEHTNMTYDSYSLYYNDTLTKGKYIYKTDLLSTLINASHNLYQYLVDDIGIYFSMVKKLNGHSYARTHFNPNDLFTGKIIANAIYNKLNNKPNIKFIFNADVIELIQNNETIVGLKYKINDKPNIFYVNTTQIILASGGYGSDYYSYDSLLNEYSSSSLSFPFTSEPESDGSIIKSAKKIGATLIDMDKIEINPTAFVDQNNRYSKRKILAPEILREEGGILLTYEGKRFCNELGSKQYIVTQIMENGYKSEYTQNNTVQYEVYLLMNEEILSKIGVSGSDYYINLGLIKKYDNLEHFSTDNGINFETLNNTINEYNKYKDDGKDIFNKVTFPVYFGTNEALYVSVVVPSVSYTMGGLKINKDAQVLNSNYSIKGLYAVGEVTGGIHGSEILSGNTLTESGVFGRIAGRNAALNITKNIYNIINDTVIYIKETNTTNTTNTNIDYTKEKKSKSLSAGSIVGVVLSSVAITAIIVIIFLLICIPKETNQNLQQSTNVSTNLA